MKGEKDMSKIKIDQTSLGQEVTEEENGQFQAMLAIEETDLEKVLGGSDEPSPCYMHLEDQ